MSIQLLAVLMALAFAFPSPGSTVHASSPAQSHRSKSDADINAIGRRRIAHGPNFYSSEKEKQIGKELAEETERSYKLLNDPAVMGYIERVAQNLAKNSDARFPITVAVVDSDAVEAFTLPGGYQFVSRGLLLQLTDDAELASVLARGIAHTALRSATTLATKAGIANLAITPVTPVPVGSSNPNVATSQVELMMASIRQKDEMDADYFGMQYMYKAGYDPKRFIDFVQRNESAGATAELPNSFPPLEVRLAALRKEISTILRPQADAIISTPGFAEFRDHLRPQDSEPPK